MEGPLSEVKVCECLSRIPTGCKDDEEGEGQRSVERGRGGKGEKGQQTRGARHDRMKEGREREEKRERGGEKEELE